MSVWWSKTQFIILMIQCPFEIWYRNHEKFMKWCDLINSGDLESQTLNLIQTSYVFCWSIHIFLCWDVKIRNRVSVLTTTAGSTDDMICFRISFMHISERAPCLITLIWRCYWTISPWIIDFDDIEKRSLNAFFEHRMNSNRSKTTCSRFYRVACCLVEESRVLLDVRMTRFFLS